MALLPKVKLKAVVSFPATILDGVGVDVVKQNGTYQFNIAFDDFAPPVAGLTDPTHQTVLVWNSVTNAYVLVPTSAFGPSPATAVPLIESGAGAVGASVKYAREDHIHPAATAGAGDVVGPSSAVDSNLAAFNTTTGKLIKDSGVPLAAASGAVRYDLSQGLSGSQQTQARQNIAALAVVKFQKFSASGTYTPSAGMLYCIIECWGGGGGGGGVIGAAANTCTSGGGGAGSKSITYASAATIGASKAVTIGGGGNGGVNAAVGANGGDTSVGSLCIGKGGIGGTFCNGSAALPVGGAGGVIGTGDITGTGAPGGTGIFIPTVACYLPGGTGGSTEIGGGGVGNSTVTAVGGLPATGPGGGGSGGSVVNSGSGITGGAGAAGYVRITEFCTQ